MTIFPPFKKTDIPVENPDLFFTYLKANIGSHGEGQGRKYQGKLTQNGFLIEKNSLVHYKGLTLVRGTFKENSKKNLTIGIETRKSVVITFAFFILFILILGLIKENVYAIPISLLILVLLYFGLWPMHTFYLKSSKIIREEIIELTKQK